MLLPGVKKAEKRSDKETLVLVPIRFPTALIGEMKKYYKPKEKSAWIADSIDDLLKRSLYIDADWSDANHSDTAGFLALLDLNEELKDSTRDNIHIRESVYEELEVAVNHVKRLFPSEGQSARPALIRAAIRQRVLLRGKLLNSLLK